MTDEQWAAYAASTIALALSCRGCRFWRTREIVFDPPRPVPDAAVGQCRLRAPQPHSFEAKHSWPLTQASDWCAEGVRLP